MKIVLDNIVFSLQNSGGISVVWGELIKRILSFKECDCLFLEFIPNNNIHRNSLLIPLTNIFSYQLNTLKYKRYLPVHLLLCSKFIFHSSYFRISSNSNAINVTTVHDFTYEYFYHGLHKWIHCWQKYYAIRKSKYVVCISENTKRDLLKFLPDIDEKKIHVIYNGVSDDYCPLSNIENYNLPYDSKSYLLFVGERKAYKNFKLVVESMYHKDWKLVIVGAKLTPDEVKILDLNVGSKHYYFAGRVSNKQLNVLYNGAKALVYPSSYEGFGIPVLEAQRAGCPVIAYNASSIPEIIGDTPLLMNSLDKEELCAKIELLSDVKLRAEIIRKGFDNVKKYAWDKMCEQLISLYKEAYNRSEI